MHGLQWDCSLIPATAQEVSILIPPRIVRDYSIFVANHNFKVRPSSSFVSVPNVIYKDTDIFNKDHITRNDIL
jgi:hypothetical protein